MNRVHRLFRSLTLVIKREEPAMTFRNSASAFAYSLYLLLAASVFPAQAEKRYGPGVTDTEIKIGQTMPYSGPASAYGTIGKAELAYVQMIVSARRTHVDESSL
jgi:hypothetical protein